jgi:hypothetical protein
MKREWANKRIEPMTGSAVTFIVEANALGALPVMAHPHRSAASRI